MTMVRLFTFNLATWSSAARRAGLHVYDYPRPQVLATVVLLLNESLSPCLNDGAKTVAITGSGLRSFPDLVCIGPVLPKNAARSALSFYTNISLPEDLFKPVCVRQTEQGAIEYVFYALVPPERKADVLRQLEYGNTQVERIIGGMNDGWRAHVARTDKLLETSEFKESDLLLAALNRCLGDLESNPVR